MSALEGVKRLRGVSWRWREGVPGKHAGAREAGVIAQEVQAVFPGLVTESERGYLMVDYGGLAVELSRAVGEIAERVEALEGRPSALPSDDRLKADAEPLAALLSRLEAARSELGGERLDGTDQTALVGLLVEAVKELDSRLRALEQRERFGVARSRRRRGWRREGR